MNTFIIALELILYAFAVYVLLKKEEMGIVYLPVLFFINTVTDNHYITAFAYYAIISIIILQLIKNNLGFFKNNIFSVFIIGYFLILMTKATNLGPMREDVFNVMWLFILLPLIPSIYKKYSREVIFKELATSSFIILVIFVVSVLVSSYYKFSPYEMYGITGGLLFGNLYATDFNIIGIAIFIVLLWSLKNRNILYLAVVVCSLAFISLSMRRSVMGISVVGTGIVTFLYLRKNLSKILPFAAGAAVVVFFILFKTDFAASMNERYELRDLQDRSLNEEQRYFEYQLLYDDVFRRHRYSLWTGYDLFNSPGNYGGGKFYDRSLHGDITSIGHSSGVIGIALYFLMMFSAFMTAYKAAQTWSEKLIVFFAAFAFLTYCLTGRYTQVGCMLMIFLTAKLPLAEEKEEVVDLKEYEEIPNTSLLLT